MALIKNIVKFNKDSLNNFQAALESIDKSWQSEFNLRDIVKESFELIKKARSYKVSWEEIATILRQSSGITEGISSDSIRQYYFEFSKNPELLSKKRKSRQKTRSSRNSTKKEPESTQEKINNSGDFPVAKPTENVDIRSQFNLGRREK